jgi:hypothetical protein
MRRLAPPAFIVAASLLGGCNAILGIRKGQPPPSCVDSEELLIDDMEDGDPSICELKGRTGAWYAVGDGTDVTGSATMTLANEAIPGRRDASWRAMHFSGSGFTAWGAIVGLNLYVPKLAAEEYDASAAGGIAFWMRNNVLLDVKLRTPATAERTAGGSCEQHDAGFNCNNHFRFAVTAVHGDWTRYEVPFTALTQQSRGTAVWDPSTLLGIEFAVPANASFDVWIDDLAFYYCAAPSCVPSCNDPALPTKCPISTSPARPAGCYPAGIDCAALGSFCADPSIIDDMEDGVGDICPSQGRGGSWYVVTDPSGGTLAMSGASLNPTLIPNGRGTSRRAAALVGSGFTDWGALMGFPLKSGASYDARAADGIRFWMKGTVPFNFQVAVPGTIPRSSGGTCDENCYRPLGFWWGDPAADWTEVRVPFTALRGPLVFDDDFNLILIEPSWSTAALSSVEFSVPGTATSEPFELWIDDVSFYSCGGGDCLPTCPASAPVACPAAGDLPAACWPAGTDCAGATDQVFYTAAWGSGPADVWAVGYSLFRPAGIIRHYDGTSWTAVGGVNVPIWDVWGSGAADAWVVADQGAVGRWDGQAWTSTNSGTNRSYNAIWGSAPDDVWAVVYPGTLRHWNGTAWSMSTSVETFLASMWGSGRDDVWAVGEVGRILHWNGAAWSTGTQGNRDLFAVWGSGAGDLWAVGAGGTILHGNGVSWSAVAPITSHDVYDVWGSGAGDAWAVGDAGTALHFNGSRWTPVAVPTKNTLTSVWGSGSADVWAVGEAGTIVHWDGTAWSAVPPAR